jgi:hypothetical protein
VWHLAGTGLLAGDYEGVAQVMGLLGKISELSGGTVRPELHDVLASADHTVALSTIRAERAGKQLQLNLVQVIHADNGKATEVWTHSSDPAPQRSSGHSATGPAKSVPVAAAWSTNIWPFWLRTGSIWRGLLLLPPG